jgi:hypothetical protein
VSTTDAIPIPPRPRSRLFLFVVVAAVVAVAIGVVAVMMRNKTPSSPAQTQPTSSVPRAQGRVALNAFPWGEVTGIRNVTSGSSVDLKAPLVTPTPIDLSPGRYEITLSNPSFRSPITRTVEVKAGEEQVVNVQFADPATATLPSFGGTSQ